MKRNRTQAARKLKQIFYEYTFGYLSEVAFESKIYACISEYKDYIFDGDTINNTVLCILGKNRSDYLIEVRSRLKE